VKAEPSGELVVRSSRFQTLGAGLLLLGIAAPRIVHALSTGDAGLVLLLALALLAPGCVLVWCGVRAAPRLVVDRDGIWFPRAGAHLAWDQIAALEIQEWQEGFGRARRLSLRAVRPAEFDAMWDGIPSRPWIPRPKDGGVEVPLVLVSPSAKLVGEAVAELSGGAFTGEIRHVRRRAFRSPEVA
jgi:hypothetical protein